MTTFDKFLNAEKRTEGLNKFRQMFNPKSSFIVGDGGINAENVGLLTSAGANVIVAGSAIFKSKKPKSVIQEMKDTAAKNPFKG